MAAYGVLCLETGCALWKQMGHADWVHQRVQGEAWYLQGAGRLSRALEEINELENLSTQLKTISISVLLEHVLNDVNSIVQMR